MKRFFLILWIVLAAADLFAQEAGWPFIRNYAPKEYEGSPQVFSVLQDKNTDILYFGAIPGLICYDGLRWKQISLPNKTIAYSIAQDAKGKIYVGAINEFGYLEPDAHGRMGYKSLIGLIADTTLKIGSVWSIKNTDKEVYFQTFDNIFQYFPSENRINIFKAGKEATFRGSFVYDNAYYVRLDKKGLMKIENGELKDAPQGAFFKDKNAFNEAAQYSPHVFLMPTRNEGIFLYDLKNAGQLKAFDMEDKNFLADNNIYTAHALNQNAFALGFRKQGLLLLDRKGRILQRYSEDNLLQDNGLYAIQGDRNQNIWLGLSNGISKTEHSQDLTYWGKNIGLKGAVYNIKRFQDKIYVAADQQTYYLDGKNLLQEVKNIPAGQSWVLKTIRTQKGEMLWLGAQTGIFSINDGRATQIYKGSHSFALLQSRSRPNRVYTTDGYHFISLLYENGRWKPEGRWHGLNEHIRGIVEDKDGNLWLGTYGNGVTWVMPDQENITKPKKIRYYTKKDGLPSLKSCVPFWFDHKIVWGTEEGLYIYNRQTDRFEPFCALGKSFCDGSRSIFGLQEMKNGKVYIIPDSNKKEDIGYLTPNNKGHYDWVYAPFRRLPEIAGLEQVYVEDNGVVWIGGSEGLFRYDESKDTRDYTQKFNCLIREARTGGDSVFYEGNANLKGLKYKHNSLGFQFAAPFFDSEEKTLYRFMLEGYESNWSEWGRITEREYSNLWEGNYTFKVEAKNIYGVKSNMAMYRVEILPPFYRTWWAYLIYLFLVGAGMLGIVKWNIKRLKNEKEHLEGIVKKRTAEVVRQKEEITVQAKNLENAYAQLHNVNLLLEDKVKQRTEQIKKAFDELLVSHQQLDNLAYRSSHDIRGPIVRLQGLCNVAKLESDSGVKDIYLDNILAVTDKMDNLLGRIMLTQAIKTKQVVPTEVVFGDLAMEVMEELRDEATANGMEMRLLGDIKASIQTDTMLAKHLLKSVIENGVRFYKKREEHPFVEVSISDSPDEITISVLDNGIGVQPEVRDKIFDMFFVSNDSLRGVGLGLFDAAKITEKLKGRIVLAEREGRLTEFVIVLPKNAIFLHWAQMIS